MDETPSPAKSSRRAKAWKWFKLYFVTAWFVAFSFRPAFGVPPSPLGEAAILYFSPIQFVIDLLVRIWVAMFP